MKKAVFFFGIILLCLQSCVVSGSHRNSFFYNSRYSGSDTKFVSVNIPVWLAKPFIKKTLREDGESEEVISLIKKVKDIKILTVENGSREMLTDFSKYLSRNKLEEWMIMKKDGQMISFRVKQDGDSIKKLMITVNSGTEMIFIDVKGNFSTSDISRIINYSEKTDLKKIVSR